MYTVGKEMLPVRERSLEAADLMQETLTLAHETSYITGVKFFGEALEDTDEPNQFKVVYYTGTVTGVITEPPSFKLMIEEAAVQVASCDCPSFDPHDIFTDFEQVMRDEALSQELDKFAGVETQDPHYEDITALFGTEMTLRFDRLGGYIVQSMIRNY